MYLVFFSGSWFCILTKSTQWVLRISFLSYFSDTLLVLQFNQSGLLSFFEFWNYSCCRYRWEFWVRQEQFRTRTEAQSSSFSERSSAETNESISPTVRSLNSPKCMDSKLESPNSMVGCWKLEEENIKIWGLYSFQKHKERNPTQLCPITWNLSLVE